MIKKLLIQRSPDINEHVWDEMPSQTKRRRFGRGKRLESQNSIHSELSHVKRLEDGHCGREHRVMIRVDISRMDDIDDGRAYALHGVGNPLHDLADGNSIELGRREFKFKAFFHSVRLRYSMNFVVFLSTNFVGPGFSQRTCCYQPADPVSIFRVSEQRATTTKSFIVRMGTDHKY